MADSLDDIDLHQVFVGQETTLLAELSAGRHAGHTGIQGDGTEDRWIAFLRDRLPRRYAVTRAIVIDSEGHRSDQIDVVIHDRHFSPRFWEVGDHHYLPAESVYAVFEVKPDLSKSNVEYASQKAASVRRLHRTSATFGWALGPMPPRPLYPILAGILCDRSSWTPAFGKPFVDTLSGIETSGRLDFGCVLGHGTFEVPHDAPLDKPVVGDAATALVAFLLTLLHRLQGLGSAPAIDYPAYMKWVTDESLDSD
jgi:hypothetical protein